MLPEQQIAVFNSASSIKEDERLQFNQKAINFAIFDQEKFKKYVSDISSWKIQSFNYNSKRERRILKQISHIKFPQLKILYMISNDIETIEGIEKIDFFSLEELYLGENVISSVRGLRKCYCKQLISLGINDNKIADGQILSAMIMKEEFDGSATNLFKQQFGDLNWVMKWPVKIMKQLYLKTTKGIEQKKLEKQLHNKFKDILIQQMDW